MFDHGEEILHALIRVKGYLPLITPFECVMVRDPCIVSGHANVTAHTGLVIVILWKSRRLKIDGGEKSTQIITTLNNNYLCTYIA